MIQYHPDKSQLQVCYFYLHPLNGKPAEIIVVLNSNCDTVQIPIPEEDLQLQAFFQRPITVHESNRFGTAPVWRIFDSWEKLEADHLKYKVSPATLKKLLHHRTSKPLRERFVIA
ncbi:hypothetical protein WG947_13995 [Pontibacter sp. H259]|uniref:hypothetical protein n=1 Tax=Pontibacter sp. H259 TaxID=3133421 RepID=UPI0030C12938